MYASLINVYAEAGMPDKALALFNDGYTKGQVTTRMLNVTIKALSRADQAAELRLLIKRVCTCPPEHDWRVFGRDWISRI